MCSFSKQRNRHTNLPAEGTLPGSLLLTNVKVRYFHSVVLSLQSHLWRSMVAVLRFCTPFKKSPVSKPSLWDDYGRKNRGSERG